MQKRQAHNGEEVAQESNGANDRHKDNGMPMLLGGEKGIFTLNPAAVQAVPPAFLLDGPHQRCHALPHCVVRELSVGPGLPTNRAHLHSHHRGHTQRQIT